MLLPAHQASLRDTAIQRIFRISTLLCPTSIPSLLPCTSERRWALPQCSPPHSLSIPPPTPSAKYFSIDGNTITKSSGNSYKLVLLDVVAGEMFLSFRTRILNKKGRLFIGVTDRVTQKERDCAEREHSIRYGCSGGSIFNATGDNKFQTHTNGIAIKEGMELLVEVEKPKVTFAAFEGKLNRGKWQVESPILLQPGRQFVPFFQVYSKGERLSWELL